MIIELNCVVMEMGKREWKGNRKRRKGESCNCCDVGWMMERKRNGKEGEGRE